MPQKKLGLFCQTHVDPCKNIYFARRPPLSHQLNRKNNFDKNSLINLCAAYKNEIVKKKERKDFIKESRVMPPPLKFNIFLQ